MTQTEREKTCRKPLAGLADSLIIGQLHGAWKAEDGPSVGLLAVHSHLPRHLCPSFTECTCSTNHSLCRGTECWKPSWVSTGLKSEEIHEHDAGKN